ncbi:MAG: peptidoglycan-binding domain-containing protein, partial [Acidobacteriota bacterium]
IVCKRLDGSSDFHVVVSPAETGDPQRKVRGIVHNLFGEKRRQIDVSVLFDDGETVATKTNDQGEFVVGTGAPRETARIRYSLSDDPADPDAMVEFEPFFVNALGVDTDEGQRRRLHNLGFLLTDDLADALLSFQGAQGLDTTGEADDETRARLTAVHDGGEPIVPESPFGEEPIRPDEMDLEDPPAAPAKEG